MKHISKRIWQLLLLFAATLVCLWLLLSGLGGYISPLKWTFPAVACLTYPAAVLAAVLLMFIALLSRFWKVAVALLIALLVTWPALRVTVPLSGKSEVADSTKTFTVLSFNVMGFDNKTAHEYTSTTMRYILDTDADLILMQEGSLGPYDFTDRPTVKPMKEEIISKYPYRSYGYHDLIIMSKYPYKVYEDTTLRNCFGAPDNGRTEFHFYAKAFDIMLPENRQLRIIAVHLQSIGLSDEDKQAYRNFTHLDSVSDPSQMHQVRYSLYAKLTNAFRLRAEEAQMLRYIIDESPENVIVCGDFNDTPASYCYWTVRGKDLMDVYAQRGLGMTYTFNRDFMFFRIDHMLYRGNLVARSVRRDKEGSSDHYPLLTTFEWLDDETKQ